MTESQEGQEYLSIDDAAKAIGWNRATVYKYVDELGMKKYKFRLNRRTYLAAADVEKLKQIKEKPWIAGIEEEKVGPKSDEDAA
jgi:DNA-binding MurR/RpiR family transcriptional regulator